MSAKVCRTQLPAKGRHPQRQRGSYRRLSHPMAITFSGDVDPTAVATATTVWDTASGKDFHAQFAPERASRLASLTTMAFSPDGLRIVSGHGDGTVILWEALTGENSLPSKATAVTAKMAHFAHLFSRQPADNQRWYGGPHREGVGRRHGRRTTYSQRAHTSHLVRSLLSRRSSDRHGQ
jgi:hypothetical protein